jgi:hypothetical protein
MSPSQTIQPRARFGSALGNCALGTHHLETAFAGLLSSLGSKSWLLSYLLCRIPRHARDHTLARRGLDTNTPFGKERHAEGATTAVEIWNPLERSAL